MLYITRKNSSNNNNIIQATKITEIILINSELIKAGVEIEKKNEHFNVTLSLLLGALLLTRLINV